MESLDRPYGDDEADYTTVDPEGHAPEGAVGGKAAGDLADNETERAAAEAAAIGGGARDPDGPPSVDDDQHSGDPAFAAVEEAGGGVAEGFELAEGQLVDNIAGAPDADRTTDGFDLDDPGTDVDDDAAADVEKALDDADPGDAAAAPRDQDARSATAQYGEPDQVDVTEVVRDPEEGDDDPGQGPGVSFDR